MPPFLSSLAAALLHSGRETETNPSTLTDEESHNSPSVPEAKLVRQHPTVAMKVAYTLFLMARAHSNQRVTPTRRRQRRPPYSLPVYLDLCAPDAVRAFHLDTGSPAIIQPPSDLDDPSPHDTTVRSDLALASDLRSVKRDIAIVTTAAIPWMTGTSVNPALRALYLAKDGHRVTLVVPWLTTTEEQRLVFPRGSPTFSNQEQQRRYILYWARKQMSPVHASFTILFYEGAYSLKLGSIMPIGSITDVFASQSVVKDVCLLEEPEHLTWHHSGKVWTDLFNIVIGIIHTNYLEYIKGYGFFGPQRALGMLFLNIWVCRGYCHRIIKLSDAVQQFPNSITCNVHGVREKFISIGRNRLVPFRRGAYFMGKVLWAKGYRELIDNMIEYYNGTEKALPIDFFGTGPDVETVQHEVETQVALSAVKFDARVADHTSELLQSYKLYVNASSSDVVCTATAEALAMGKLVVCLDHPSNEFFATFPNCTTFSTASEFAVAMDNALQMEPVPLSDYDAYRLTWEAATERLYDAVRIPLSKRHPSKVGHALANVHCTISKMVSQPGAGIRKAMSMELLQDEPKTREV